MRYYKEVDGRLLSEDVEEIVHATEADLRMEGMRLSADERELVRKVVANEMTPDEAIALILQKVTCHDGHA